MLVSEEVTVTGSGSGWCDDGREFGELRSVGVDLEEADEIGAEIWDGDEVARGVGEGLMGVRSVLSCGVGAGRGEGEGECLEEGEGSVGVDGEVLDG